MCIRDSPLDTDDFRLELTARNGCMDHRNTPTDSVSTCYLPFMQESANLEDIQVVHAGMNTLRLMENDDTRLRLIHQPDGKEIFDIPLTPYLLLSRNVETTYKAMIAEVRAKIERAKQEMQAAIEKVKLIDQEENKE